MTDDSIRLDKWLWAARFYKTRALAKKAIEGGKVQYQGTRSKPSRAVELNATVTVRQGWSVKTVVVKGLSEQRRGAKEAMLLYQETPESVARRELESEQRKLQRSTLPQYEQRPNKRQRRQIIRFKNIHDQQDDAG